MATALFIKPIDIKRNTIIDGNVDVDKFIQFIKIAQQIHVRNYLGSELYNKISSDIVADTLTGDYLSLVNTLYTTYAYSFCYGRLFTICSLPGKERWSV